MCEENKEKMNTKIEDKTKFEMRAYNEERFLETIEKLRKKIDIVIKTKEYFNTFTFRRNIKGEEVKVVNKNVRFELEFPEIYIIEGFDYLGGLTAKDGTPTFFSDTETELHKMVNDDLVFKCYHCNKKIPNRLSKLYFKKTDTGEIVNFGTKCVENYFGIDIVRKLKWATTVCETLGDVADSDYYGGGRGYYEKHAEKMDFLIGYFEMGKVYMSKAKAEYSRNTATADDCTWYVNPNPYETKDIKYEREHYFDKLETPTEEIEKIKKEIYKFYEEREVKTDFDYNLKAVFETLGEKTGLLAYGVYFYYKTKKEAEEAKLGKKFVPEYYEGEEIKDMEVTCHCRRWFDGTYGTTYIVTFRSDKHSFVWFTASDKIGFIKEKGKYKIKKAKVIGRDEFKGFKNTKIKSRFNWIEDLNEKEEGEEKKTKNGVDVVPWDKGAGFNGEKGEENE